MGLLCSSWNTDDEEEDDNMPEYGHATTSDDQSALAQEWHAWIAREQDRRAAWAAFEYDCSLCTLTGRRGVVDLGELPPRLPCVEPLWNAASPQAWSALRSRLGPNTFSPNLSTVLKTALAGKEVPSTLGSWAARLCAQVLGRLLWDLKQLEIVAMPDHFGLNCLLNAHKESKRSILNALMSILTLTASPFSTAELITYK